MVKFGDQTFYELPQVSASSLGMNLDPSAAWMVGPEICRRYGIIPFALSEGALCIASAEGKPADSRFLHAVEPVRWYRTGHEELYHAQLRIFGPIRNQVSRFGDIACARGLLTPEAVEHILETQRSHGGLIGQICLMQNLLTGWDIAEILSDQTRIPALNLLKHRPPNGTSLMKETWDLLDEHDWRKFAMVPVTATDKAITVGISDPFSHEGRLFLSTKTGKSVRSVITGKRDIESILNERYQANDLNTSRFSLRDHHPDDSADQTITRPQILTMAGALVLGVALLIWHPVTTMAVVSSILIFVYALLVAYRLWIIRDGTRVPAGIVVDEATMQDMNDSTLPIYTILIPARDETRVLPLLTRALVRLDYPKDRLDVKLILEEDDIRTIRAAREAHLPSFVEIVIVPATEPRTKPKACNFALQMARGEFITIFDAEDSPEPTQLKRAVLAFRTGEENMACVQAKLSYFNATQNLLTRWFTAEYAAWFDLFLPALHAARLPIPLGGTSNHFRTEILRQLGAWDPFNVTEDADLGVRIFKAGYTTSVMDSVTYEEANSDFVNWIRQRSRWIKGYLQTWLVHMRHPRQLYQQLGPRGFWGFQMSILGTPLMFLLNPLYWFLTSLWFMTHWNLIPQLFPPGIYYLGMINLLVGNFTFVYLNAIGAAKRDHWDLIPYTLLTPIYWSMMSLASWKALMQLITRPSHWEKTEHGLINWEKVNPEQISLNQ